jgi:hypothetical protein
MGCRRSRLFSTPILYVVVSIAFLVCPAERVLAQQPIEHGPPPNMDGMLEMRRRQQQEARLRSAEVRPPAEKTDPRRVKAAVDQIQKDFTHIQISRNEMVRALKSEKPLDYKFVLETTGDIHKRANRLKLYLIPGDVEPRKNSLNFKADDSEAMKGALVKLCNLIIRFTENPALRNFQGVVDAQESVKAGNDLVTIIDLSAGIKNSAEKLSKSSQ